MHDSLLLIERAMSWDGWQHDWRLKPAPHLVLEVKGRAAADDDRAALELRGVRAVAWLPRRLPRVVLPDPLHQAHVAVRVRRARLEGCAAGINMLSHRYVTSWGQPTVARLRCCMLCALQNAL